MSFDQRFGERVRDLRLAAGRTQEDVAAHMGVAVSTISRLERGVVGVNSSRLPALATALGVSVEVLFEGVAEMPPVRRVALGDDQTHESLGM